MHLQLNQLRVQPQIASKPKVAARVEFVRTNFAAKHKAPKGCDCKSCCNCRKWNMMEKWQPRALMVLSGLTIFYARLRITSSKICFHCSSWFCKLQKLLGVWFVFTIYNKAWKLLMVHDVSKHISKTDRYKCLRRDHLDWHGTCIHSWVSLTPCVSTQSTLNANKHNSGTILQARILYILNVHQFSGLHAQDPPLRIHFNIPYKFNIH